MKNLICTVMFLVILASGSYAESGMDIIVSLKSEIESMEKSLTSIRNESNQMRLYLNKLVATTEIEKQLLNDRLAFLEAESKRLTASKQKLQERLDLLSASDNSLDNLKTNYETEVGILESQINLRDWTSSMAMGLATGMAMYQATGDPWISAGSGLGGALLTFFVLKVVF